MPPEHKPEDQGSYYSDCGHCVDEKEKEKKQEKDVNVHAQWLSGLTDPWTDTEDDKEEGERENPYTTDARRQKESRAEEEAKAEERRFGKRLINSVQIGVGGYSIRPATVFMVMTKKGPIEAGEQLKKALEGAELEHVAQTENIQMLKIKQPGRSERRKRSEERADDEARKWEEIGEAGMAILQKNQRKKWEQRDKEEVETKAEEAQEANHQTEKGRSKEEKRQIADPLSRTTGLQEERGCQCGECYDNMGEASHRAYKETWKEVVTKQEEFLKEKGINVSYNYNDSSNEENTPTGGGNPIHDKDPDHSPEANKKQKKEIKTRIRQNLTRKYQEELNDWYDCYETKTEEMADKTNEQKKKKKKKARMQEGKARMHHHPQHRLLHHNTEGGKPGDKPKEGRKVTSKEGVSCPNYRNVGLEHFQPGGV